MKKFFCATSIIVTLSLIFLSTCKYLENTRSYFANYKEMEGNIGAGCSLRFFPRSATDIYEGHNIDTNDVWASFNYDAKDVPILRTMCRVLAENEAGVKLNRPPFMNAARL